MLKAVIIGTHGHFHFALDAIKNGESCEIIAAAPGPDGHFSESVKTLLQAEYFDDYKEMLEATKPDIAIVNPQFSYISECAVEAVLRGINVFCEKPLSITWKGIADIENALKSKDVRICAMMGMRYEAPFAALKKLIENNELGDVRMIHAQKSYKLGMRPEFYKKRKTYGGTIPWVGSHPIDMIYWLTGNKRYKKVTASHSAMRNENHGELEATAALLFEMEDEVFATVNIDYLRPKDSTTHGDDRIRVVGERNWAQVIDGKLYVGDKQKKLKKDGNIFSDFCGEVSGGKECGVSNKGSIYITKVCLAARDSADTKKPVEIGDKL